MNTDDHESPTTNRQANGTELGSESEWLTDSVVEEPASDTEEAGATSRPVADIHETTELIEGSAVPLASAPVVVSEPRSRPWLWSAVPMIFLVVTAIIVWFGSSPGLNNLTTWPALKFQHSPLLPARWSMLMVWVVLALLAVFLIYSAFPAGREITRIKPTGPLISLALTSASLWIFAQHWQWQEVGLGAMIVSLSAILVSYLLVALSPRITKPWQRLFAVTPLSAALAYTIMLLTLSWQGVSDQPFGETGTSVLLLFLLVMVAAVFAFFMRDGVLSMVFTIWFLGVAQQQWGNEVVISLGAIVALIFTAAISAMGFILAVESQQPSLTTEVSARRGRINFFRKSENSPPPELP